MANWQAQTSRRIIKRVIATGTLILDTSAHFGNGEQNGSELIILEDKLEKRPLIPGASLAGALRHYLLSLQAGYRAVEHSSHIAVKLFGTALDNSETGVQSRVIVDDALGTGSMQIRHGVKIDGMSRTAEDGALYSLQVWEPNTNFELSLELELIEGDDIELYETAFAAALLALQKGEIRMGARKHRGYGRCHVESWHLSAYEMQTKTQFLSYLKNDRHEINANDFLQKAKDFVDNRKFVEVDAFMFLCDSILIREDSDLAESAHLGSAGKAIVSGTSIAGALRARALKILNTIEHPQAQIIVDKLFGKHGESQTTESYDASRLIIDEYPIEDYQFDYIQNRVKIDRFTSGAFETALFDERPIFATDKTQIHIKMQLLYPVNSNEEALLTAQTGLVFLLLKDLATEDLPLGAEASIGRGRLRGDEAMIRIKSGADEPQQIHIVQNHIDPRHIPQLQAFVDSLWKDLDL
jgi:CRISPR/Cas system CSM-associated protein Csm3 (group 7 of RAMP superfamily)